MDDLENWIAADLEAEIEAAEDTPLVDDIDDRGIET